MSFVNDKEITAAEKEAATSKSVYKHTFDSPLQYEDHTYEDLTFDFSKLTGMDSLEIEAELQALGKAVVVPELSGEYMVRVAARSAKVGSDLLMAIPMADWHRIRAKVRSFLLKSVL